MNLLTLREVADAVKVSETTVRRWMRAGFLPAYKVGKRGQFRVSEEDLKAFLERQRIDASADGSAADDATLRENPRTLPTSSTAGGKNDGSSQPQQDSGDEQED